MEDSYWHKGLRKRLVLQLEQQGITDKKVLEIMGHVPRHLFIDTALAQHAYENSALPILSNQTLSHPFTVAFQTQLLNPKQNEKILEIGTGSGYQTAILANFKASIFTIERQKLLYNQTKELPIMKKYYNIKYFYGDGYKGLNSYAPFDKILITAAVPTIPHTLIEQLKIGGILVMPKDANDMEQEMTKITKIDAQHYEEKYFGKFSFVPMLKGTSYDDT